MAVLWKFVEWKNVSIRIFFTTFSFQTLKYARQNTHKNQNVSRVTSINSLSSWFNQIFRHEFAQLQKNFWWIYHWIPNMLQWIYISVSWIRNLIEHELSISVKHILVDWLHCVIDSSRKQWISGRKSRTRKVLITIEILFLFQFVW